MSKHVLVTGGLGMLGGYVTRAMLAEGLTPVLYDRRDDTSGIADVAGDCILEMGEIGDLARLQALIVKYRPSAIVHLAALVGESVDASAYDAFQINLGGVVNVLECARREAVPRVVMISSKMVYGPIRPEHQHPNYLPVTEDHPREPVLLYGKLKRAAEDMADHYVRHHDLDVVALRFASLFAPGKTGRSKLASPLLSLIEAARAGCPFVLAQGADQMDGITYAGDAARAVAAAVQSKRPAGSQGLRSYNISSDTISLADIVQTLKRLFPKAEISAGPGLDYRGYGNQGNYFAMNTLKAKRELGYVAAFPFDKAAADYCQTMDRVESANI